MSIERPPIRAHPNTNITFTLEKPIDVAVAGRARQDRTHRRRFPNNAGPPVIQKNDPDSSPILTLAMYGSRDPKELTDIVDQKIKQVIETINGVASVQFNGDRQPADSIAAQRGPLECLRNSVDQLTPGR
jgi:HAE1 family hydrophobic/amphiphilic exporter-1